MQVVSVWLINQNENKYKVYDNWTEEAPIHAYFEDKNETHGFYHLSVVQNENVKIDDFTAATTAGYAEGYLTYRQMDVFAQNAMRELEINAEMLQHVENQLSFIDQYGSYSAKLAKAWHFGMYQGYAQACELAAMTALSRAKIWIISSIMDMEDLEAVFGDGHIFKDRPTHCTGMVIAAPDFKDVFFSHVSWNSYQSGFVRIMKNYVFYWSLAHTKRQNVHFSSYPGYLSSVDDYYIVDNEALDGSAVHLAILETTYGVKNESIYDEIIIPTNKEGHGVMSWIRVMAATLGATNAAEWYEEFRKDASWTYNNNYLFLDYGMYDQVVGACKKCSANELKAELALKPQILYSLEVVPPSSLNYSEAEVRPLLFSGLEYLLANRFFISMNTPINMSLFLYLGYDPEDAYYGFNNSARLNISQHLAANVDDFESFRRFMRYNDYTSPDNFQKNDSGDGISARYDLRDSSYANISIHGPSQFGATDCKATSMYKALRGEFDVLVGHTRGVDGKYPAYNFSEHVDQVHVVGVHDVLPAVWDTLAPCGAPGFAYGCQSCAPHFLIASGCTQCEDGYSFSNGQCTGNSNVGLICAITIPLAVLLVCFVAWVVYYMKKRAQEIKSSEQGEDEETPLTQQ